MVILHQRSAGQSHESVRAFVLLFFGARRAPLAARTHPCPRRRHQFGQIAPRTCAEPCHRGAGLCPRPTPSYPHLRSKCNAACWDITGLANSASQQCRACHATDMYGAGPWGSSLATAAPRVSGVLALTDAVHSTKHRQVLRRRDIHRPGREKRVIARQVPWTRRPFVDRADLNQSWRCYFVASLLSSAGGGGLFGTSGNDWSTRSTSLRSTKPAVPGGCALN